MTLTVKIAYRKDVINCKLHFKEYWLTLLCVCHRTVFEIYRYLHPA